MVPYVMVAIDYPLHYIYVHYDFVFYDNSLFAIVAVSVLSGWELTKMLGDVCPGRGQTLF